MNRIATAIARPAALCASLLLVLILSSCGRSAAPPAADTSAPAAGQSLPGNTFNRFFPTAGDGYSLTYTQEKAGFAEARLSRDSTDLALLSVSDTNGNPSARTKFDTASMEVRGFPAVNVGNNGLAVLVADRFQVQVRATDANFTAAERQQWLEKFDLNGIAGLQ
ncbi:MAG: hypothetical protein HC911_05475 [Chloroflexaceae bacterium]|nr:hypothetical protein [Chloroflexaceae bacterium]